MPVRSLYVMPNPCEKYSALPAVRCFLDRRPHGDLAGVGKQVLDDGTLCGCLFDLEKRLAGNPAVGYGLVPTLGAFALAHDDVEAIVLEVEGLSGTLYAVSDHGDRFIFERFESLREREFVAGDHIFLDPSEIHFCHGCNVFWLIIPCFISFLVLF